MTRMKEPSSNVTDSIDDDKNLEWLLEAFGSKVSMEDMASAYSQAGHDLHKTSEILCNMLGSSSSNAIPISMDDLTCANTSSVGSADSPVGKSYGPNILSQPKPTNCGLSMGTVSEVTGANHARSGTLVNEPPMVLSRPKPRHSGVSAGTVSGIIGAGYARSRTSTKEAREMTKPVKLMSSEFPVSQIWDEKLQSDNATNETMNKDVELFLLRMLGDGFQLDTKVIREVVGDCGYDVRESMEKLMNMSAPALDLGHIPSSMVDQTSMETCPDLDFRSEEKLQFRDSAGSDRSNIEKEVLSTLFTVPERSVVGPRKILPTREPRTRKYGVVTGPLEDPVTEFRTPIVKKEVNGDGNEEIEDNYETLREAVTEYWATMKQYYRAAADAYTNGSYERADKLVEEGHFFMDKARETDEMSAKKLIQTRDDGEAISIDLNDYDPKEAIRLLKTHLRSMSGIPSIRYLKVIVGTNDDKTKQSARKRLISKLLERDTITWTEEQDGQIMAIRIDVINPKRLSFNKK